MNVALIFQSRARSKRLLIGLSLSLIPGEPRIMKTNGRKQRRSYFKSGIWERECHLSHTCATLQHAFSWFALQSSVWLIFCTRYTPNRLPAIPSTHPPVINTHTYVPGGMKPTPYLLNGTASTSGIARYDPYAPPRKPSGSSIAPSTSSGIRPPSMLAGCF